MTKRKGVKVTVFAKAVEGGEDVKEVKPAERLTELVSAPEGYVAGAVVEEKDMPGRGVVVSSRGRHAHSFCLYSQDSRRFTAILACICQAILLLSVSTCSAFF